MVPDYDMTTFPCTKAHVTHRTTHAPSLFNARAASRGIAKSFAKERTPLTRHTYINSPRERGRMALLCVNNIF